MGELGPEDGDMVPDPELVVHYASSLDLGHRDEHGVSYTY